MAVWVSACTACLTQTIHHCFEHPRMQLLVWLNERTQQHVCILPHAICNAAALYRLLVLMNSV